MSRSRTRQVLLSAASGALSGAAAALAVAVLAYRRRPRQPEDQQWFWTPEWLTGEAEATNDILAGRVENFEDPEHFLKAMHEEPTDFGRFAQAN